MHRRYTGLKRPGLSIRLPPQRRVGRNRGDQSLLRACEHALPTPPHTLFRRSFPSCRGSESKTKAPGGLGLAVPCGAAARAQGLYREARVGAGAAWKPRGDGPGGRPGAARSAVAPPAPGKGERPRLCASPEGEFGLGPELKFETDEDLAAGTGVTARGRALAPAADSRERPGRGSAARARRGRQGLEARAAVH